MNFKNYKFFFPTPRDCPLTNCSEAQPAIWIFKNPPDDSKEQKIMGTTSLYYRDMVLKEGIMKEMSKKNFLN